MPCFRLFAHSARRGALADGPDRRRRRRGRARKLEQITKRDASRFFGIADATSICSQAKTRENVLLQGRRKVAHGGGKFIANEMNIQAHLIALGMSERFRLAETQALQRYNNERKLLLQ
jgi:hypothetical protein